MAAEAAESPAELRAAMASQRQSEIADEFGDIVFAIVNLGRHLGVTLDADALSRALGTFALGDAKGGHIAIDGKTLKGSRRHDAKALHVVSAFATGLSAVVGDLVVAPEQNEITAALALLKGLPLDGAIITGDAIFCQRQICQHIKDSRGHYLFAVKKNQPELHDAIAESFGDLSPLRGSRRSAA